jgi:hypothetical protein
MSGIFLSYRRSDSLVISQMIFELLTQRFPSAKIFRDIDAILPGQDFQQILQETLRDSSMLLAIIGPQWLSMANVHGQRRLDDPGDYVRLEIEAALLQGIPIFVLRLPGVSELPLAQLPCSLSKLATCRSFAIQPNDVWQPKLDEVCKAIVTTEPHLGHWSPAYLWIVLIATPNLGLTIPVIFNAFPLPSGLPWTVLLQIPSLLCLAYAAYTAARLRRSLWTGFALFSSFLCLVWGIYGVSIMALVFGLVGPTRALTYHDMEYSMWQQENLPHE